MQKEAGGGNHPALLSTCQNVNTAHMSTQEKEKNILPKPAVPPRGAASVLSRRFTLLKWGVRLIRKSLEQPFEVGAAWPNPFSSSSCPSPRAGQVGLKKGLSWLGKEWEWVGMPSKGRRLAPRGLSEGAGESLMMPLEMLGPPGTSKMLSRAQAEQVFSRYLVQGNILCDCV